jgi:hypothetical protein
MEPYSNISEINFHILFKTLSLTAADHYDYMRLSQIHHYLFLIIYISLHHPFTACFF